MILSSAGLNKCWKTFLFLCFIHIRYMSASVFLTNTAPIEVSPEARCCSPARPPLPEACGKHALPLTEWAVLLHLLGIGRSLGRAPSVPRCSGGVEDSPRARRCCLPFIFESLSRSGAQNRPVKPSAVLGARRDG